ncbi:MAG: ABC transporter permease [Chloroflexi bacterium]|nr:ABC transporter permease [Chloroflexota bacterium]MBV9596197.1 ABC transporter permease [Chloroflexota bacterium]
MLVFAVRRLLQAVPVLILSSIAIFLLLRLIPGDLAVVLAGTKGSPEVIAALRKDLGLDQPLPVQYVVWLAHILKGDLGTSGLSGQPIAVLLFRVVPSSLELAAASMVLIVLVGMTTGILAALHPRGAMDWSISGFNSLVIAVPNFWFGILAITLFSVTWQWLPPGGQADFSRDPGLAIKSFILPAITLALPGAGGLSRFVKGAMLDVLSSDHVRTARAKGLPGRRVVLTHALRNALIPIITIIGLQFGFLIGGVVIVEYTFGWPGVGRLILAAINNRDYAIVQAGLLFLIVVYLLVNLTVDLLCGIADPRVRLSGSR